MIKEYKNLIITIGVILAIVGIYNGYQRYQAKKVATELQAQELVRAQQEKEAKTEEERKKQDLEVTKLKDDLEALKNQKPKTQTIIKEVPTPSTKTDLQAIIKYWHPIVVYVLCEFDYSDGTAVYQSGSGTLNKTQHTTSGTLGIKVMTNRHVLVAEGFNGPTQCSVVVPFDKTYTMVNDGSSDITGRDDVDLGGIVINNPSTYLQNLPLLQQQGINACGSIPDLGSPIAILGYPAIGSRTDITITQGIISAYEGDYYVTDAKIEHGNSGGAAIDINNNCYLGIPTWVETGTVESLGRILKWQAT